jgi:hypothetical protein
VLYFLLKKMTSKILADLWDGLSLNGHSAAKEQTLRGCLFPFNFGFWSIILHNGTKHHAFFFGKKWLFSFSILISKDPKKKAQKSLKRPS